MKCKNCGYDSRPEDKICPSCGGDFEQDKINQKKIQKAGRMVKGIIILLVAIAIILLALKALKFF